MAYQVKISNTALVDAEEYVAFIRERNQQPDAADRWFRELIACIFSLEEMPLRCPLIPEENEFTVKLRQILYHSHRIIFYVDEDTREVTVLRIYHGSRKQLKPDDAGEV